MFCDDVFKQIEAKKAEGDKTEFEVYLIPLLSFVWKREQGHSSEKQEWNRWSAD